MILADRRRTQARQGRCCSAIADQLVRRFCHLGEQSQAERARSPAELSYSVASSTSELRAGLWDSRAGAGTCGDSEQVQELTLRCCAGFPVARRACLVGRTAVPGAALGRRLFRLQAYNLALILYSEISSWSMSATLLLAPLRAVLNIAVCLPGKCKREVSQETIQLAASAVADPVRQ